MKTDHLKLYLSEGRPLDAVQSIQDQITTDAKQGLESIQDPETLLSHRKTLRTQKEALEATIKRMKTTNTKTNKQRSAMIAQWDSFVAGVAELSRKHGIDFEQFPSHLTSGKTFVQMLQNIRPDTFAKVEGLRIPQKRTDNLLDDKKIELFEIEAKSVILEEIIKKKSTALKALFDNDLE